MMKMRFECSMRWEDLDGDSNIRRHCGACDREVFNITAMTRDMAQRLLSGVEKPCVRYVSRNGRVVHNGDPAEQLRSQRAGAGKLLAGALLVQAAFVAIVESPAEHVFDPFAAAMQTLKDQGEKPQKKFEEANTQVVTGVVF